MFLQQFYEDSFYSYAKSREKFSIRERVYSNIYEKNTYENNLMSDTSPLQKIHAKLPNEHSLLTLIENFNVFAYLLNNQCIFKIGNEKC